MLREGGSPGSAEPLPQHREAPRAGAPKQRKQRKGTGEGMARARHSLCWRCLLTGQGQSCKSRASAEASAGVCTKPAGTQGEEEEEGWQRKP